MNKPCNILGIAGSLRRESYNRSAMRAATELAPPGATIEVFELDGIPGFSQDDEQRPPAKVVELKRRVRAADALLFVTPEYNYSISGVLKNAIDWASRPYGDNAWYGKPAAVIGASIGGIGTARAQYHLRQVFVFLNVHAINEPEVMIGHAADKFDGDGTLTDGATREKIRELLQNLVEWTERLRPPKARGSLGFPLKPVAALRSRCLRSKARPLTRNPRATQVGVTRTASRSTPTERAIMPLPSFPSQPTIVILGAGFGGLYTARRLDALLKRTGDPGVSVVLIHRHNYFLMTPLLF